MRISFTADGPTGSVEADDWRDLAAKLGAEPSLGRVEELRAPIRPGTLGGDLYGLIAEVGAAGLIALGAVVQSWIRLRAGRFKVSWEKDREGGRTVITVDGTNASGAESARALLDEIARAVENDENGRRQLPRSPGPDGPAGPGALPGSGG
ncbi:hypothetical protein OOK31_00625 [Streptomyces sp. NBC_00249]|uniref:effector-associated constant component EACC1 n=1 Tax=Streptomyces sp. NBC_00249 TaxID=2975690 RepID=UPI00224CF236|nr:hypothetical protein [Streptomyces sp. NBC_00249]MCX5192404.1 hypothetical protein [Streptomyces sp. NBC_00249]